MLLLLLISIISQCIAFPISNSASGSGSGSESGSNSGFRIQITDTIDDDDDYTCETSCKVFTYFFLAILYCCLITFFAFVIFIIYQTCVKDMIRSCIKCTKQKCYVCEKHTTRDNQYIENHDYQQNKLSYYDKFITMYNSMYKKEKHLNYECPICLEPIKKDFYTLHCKHAYHTQCMKQYINSGHFQEQCALCRNIIDI